MALKDGLLENVSSANVIGAYCLSFGRLLGVSVIRLQICGCRRQLEAQNNAAGLVRRCSPSIIS